MASGTCSIGAWQDVDARTMLDFIDLRLSDGIFANRSRYSYLSEWRAHRFLYELGIERERTGFVDLDMGETFWRKLAYFVLSILYPRC